MCLSKVYANKEDSESLLLSNIQRIVFDGDIIVFTDLMERETRIQGRLILADMVGGKVIVDTQSV